MKLGTSNLGDRFIITCPSLSVTNRPLKGRDQGHVTTATLEFYTLEISSERLMLQTSNSVHACTVWPQEVLTFSLQMTNCPLSRRGQGHVTHFTPLKYIWNG